MAKLVYKQVEENPENPGNGVCLFAYFEGTPIEEDLKAAQKGADGYVFPVKDCEEVENEVSRRAGLQRWMLAC